MRLLENKSKTFKPHKDIYKYMKFEFDLTYFKPFELRELNCPSIIKHILASENIIASVYYQIYCKIVELISSLFLFVLILLAELSRNKCLKLANLLSRELDSVKMGQNAFFSKK